MTLITYILIKFLNACVIVSGSQGIWHDDTFLRENYGFDVNERDRAKQEKIVKGTIWERTKT